MSKSFEDWAIEVARQAARVENADRQLREAVAKARAANVPWSVIGDALGVSKQAAQQRFG